MTSSPYSILGPADRDDSAARESLQRAADKRADDDAKHAVSVEKIRAMHGLNLTPDQRADIAADKTAVRQQINDSIKAAQEAGDKELVRNLKANLLTL